MIEVFWGGDLLFVCFFLSCVCVRPFMSSPHPRACMHIAPKCVPDLFSSFPHIAGVSFKPAFLPVLLTIPEHPASSKRVVVAIQARAICLLFFFFPLPQKAGVIK